jgi:hypothetical protein
MYEPKERELVHCTFMYIYMYNIELRIAPFSHSLSAFSIPFFGTLWYNVGLLLAQKDRRR